MQTEARQRSRIEMGGWSIRLHAAPDEEEGSSLEDVVRDEEEVPRRRLREQLGREPTDEEVSDWLRQHTEGY